MKSAGILAIILLSVPSPQAWSHPMMGAITWNRQVSRIVYARCVGCHRDGGTAFSLLEYAEARQAAEAIKRAVLSRSMPPWGAVKGFGDLRDDRGLDQAQIEMIADWADTGTARGNNPRALPERPPAPKRSAPFEPPRNAVPVSGDLTLERPLRLAWLYPRDVAPSASLQIVAELPDGSVTPLVWLDGYRDDYAHAFLVAEGARASPRHGDPRCTAKRNCPAASRASIAAQPLAQPAALPAPGRHPARRASRWRKSWPIANKHGIRNST